MTKPRREVPPFLLHRKNGLHDRFNPATLDQPRRFNFSERDDDELLDVLEEAVSSESKSSRPAAISSDTRVAAPWRVHESVDMKTKSASQSGDVRSQLITTGHTTFGEMMRSDPLIQMSRKREGWEFLL